MTKIIINDTEFNVENFKQDNIRSEITNKNLLRIKCEITLDNRQDHLDLEGILKEEKFRLVLPEKKLELEAREGEISYNYTSGNPFKDENVEYIHVLELIEYEDTTEHIKQKVEEDPDIVTKLYKRVAALEKILIDKGVTTKMEIDKLL